MTTLSAAAALVVSIISSILAEFIPGWAKWENEAAKRGIMALINIAAPVGIWAAICPGKLPISVDTDCSTRGILIALGIGIGATFVNKGVFEGFSKPRIRDA